MSEDRDDVPPLPGDTTEGLEAVSQASQRATRARKRKRAEASGANTVHEGAPPTGEAGAAEPPRIPYQNPDDPLEGLVARVLEHGPRAAFDPGVLEAAALAMVEAPDDFAALRAELKPALAKLGDGVGRWGAAVTACARERKRAAKLDAQREAREQAAARRAEFARALEARGRVTSETAEGDEPDPFFRTDGAYTVLATASVGGKAGCGVYFDRIDRRSERLVVERLTNFAVRLDAQRECREASPPQRTYRLTVRLESGAERAVTLEAGEFMRGAWVSRELGAGAWVNPELSCDAWKTAAQGLVLLFADAPTERVFKRTGWHEHEGRWVYVDAGGALGAEGREPGLRAEVEGYPNTGRYALPDPSSGEALAADVRALSELLAGLDAPQLVAPVFALALRSVLGPSRAQVFVHGYTGTGKSELLALAMRLFGPGFRNGRSPGSFTSSRPVLDGLLATIGDALVTLDDADTNTASGVARFREVAQAVLAAVWDGSPTLRANVDGTPRAAAPYRATPLCAAEKTLTGASLASRVVVLEHHARLGTSLDPYIATGNEGVYARAVAAFLVWLAPELPAVRAELEGLEARLGAPFREQGDRIAVSVGALLAGVEVFERFARHVGAHEPAHFARAREGLALAAHGQVEVRRDAAPGRLALELLRGAVESKHAYFTKPDGTEPLRSLALGWASSHSDALRTGDGGASEERRETRHTKGQCLGYVEHRGARLGEVAIIPEVALRVARGMARASGREFTVDSEKELGAVLDAAGLLTRTELANQQRTRCVRLRVTQANGQPSKRSLCLAVRWFEPDDDEHDEGDEPLAPPATVTPIDAARPGATARTGGARRERGRL